MDFSGRTITPNEVKTKNLEVQNLLENTKLQTSMKSLHKDSYITIGIPDRCSLNFNVNLQIVEER